MKTLKIACAVVLTLFVAGNASAAPIYVWGASPQPVAASIDVNKTGSGDTFLCWAVAASNALAWSGWWGWNSGSSSYIQSATDIFNTFNAGWTDTTGTAMYAYEWWMTSQTNSKLTGSAQLGTPPGGLGFYPTQGDWDTLPADRAWGYTQQSLASGQNPTPIYSGLASYLANQQVLVGSFHVGASSIGAYDHDVTIWGWDPDAMEIYLTDGDDGVTALQTYSFYQDANGRVWIDGYTNPYTNPIDVMVDRLVRLNLNQPFVEPAHTGGGGGGTVPDPASTLLLFGMGLSGLIFGRRSLKK